MIVIGVTGSIGMGKSTAAAMLLDMKIPVHDSDACVHALLAANGTGVVPVGTAFPESYDHKTNSIDRKKLRSALGSEHEKWDELEKLLHPLVRASQQEFINEQRSKGGAMVALDIPLLFETGVEARCDYTVVISAPEFIQRQRVLQKMSEEDFAFRSARQMPDSQKRARADFIVPSGLGLAEMRAELEDVIRKIRSKGNGNNHLPTYGR